jgi:hypothetical protein
MDMMAGTGAAVVGTVLNGIETTVFSGGYGYGYYSYSRYGKYDYSGRQGYYGYQGYGEKTGGKEDSPDIQNK